MVVPVDPKPMSRGVALAYGIGTPLLFGTSVFVPAGDIGWISGWVFLAVLVASFGASALVIAKVNPVIYRARSRFQQGTEKWDVVLVTLILSAMAAEILVASLDAGRMHWSHVSSWAVLFGYALLLAGIAVTAWAQAVNPFFEPGVRIQSERGQRPISNGPYRFIRHPGYAAAIGMFLGIPLALASWWGLIPGALASALLVVRTSLEDRLLAAQLPGYAEYARKTRYRLAPGVW
ncbi:MAG TPA: isoprenylcysteine carboxylmethyltransferase family protein [Caulobacteraceae bacterium]|jgi:protein-S-isoprenylcysteine O-methyltransferase Ste14